MTEIEMAKPAMSAWLTIGLTLGALPFVLRRGGTMRSVGFGLLSAAAAALLLSRPWRS